MTQRVALVTGASSGIGKTTTELLARNNYYVFAIARRMDRLEQMRSDHIEPIYLDVTDAEAIRASVDHVISTKGRIDVLVNNAAFGQLGAIECVSMEAARHQFDVNVFGYRASYRQYCRICGSRSQGALSISPRLWAEWQFRVSVGMLPPSMP